jgi:hypothetical protein
VFKYTILKSKWVTKAKEIEFNLSLAKYLGAAGED